jgi:hypothetical protein
MKQKDLATIGAAIIFSAVFSYIISGKIITTPNNRQQQIETVSAISPNFPTASAKYFNSSSVDPTQLIQIGQNSNSSPFGNGTN